jgi:hypothetical protein
MFTVTPVKDAGDIGVLHERQGLPLSLKSGNDLPGVLTRLDNLERDPAANGSSLLGHEDDAHSPLTDLP